MKRMNLTGDVLGSRLGLSLPREEIAGPQTRASGRAAFSASYDLASVSV
jgi:hypothetical protein